MAVRRRAAALFTAQNGVANEPAALRLFADVHAVCVWLPATHLDPGVVVANGHPHPGMLHLGRYPSGSDDTDRAVAADLTAAGFVAPVRDDVMRWKYGKLLGNLGNGLQALLGRDVPDGLRGAGPRRGRGGARRGRHRAHLASEEAAERGDQVAAPAGAAARSGPAAPPGRVWPGVPAPPRPTTSTARSCCSAGCTACRRR